MTDRTIDEGVDVERALARLERAADEAYSRYAGTAELERIDGISAALRDTLSAEPDVLRSVLLDTMAQRYQPRQAPTVPGEIDALRAEVERLRRSTSTAPVREPSETVLLRALLGRDAERFAPGALPDSTRVAAVVEKLTAFAVDLTKAFLGATDRKSGDTARQVDRFRTTLHAELSGTAPVGSFAELLEEIKRKVAAPLEIIPGACNDGARQMLRELDPLVLDDQASESGVRWLGYRPFRFREAWQVFQQRHQELVAAEDLYKTYFDAPVRKALHRWSAGRSSHA